MCPQYLDEIRRLLPADAIPCLDEYIALNPSDDEALLLRGLRHWALGHRALAINDYHAAIALNPDSHARLALQTANEILDFYNKDLLNP